MSGNAPQFKIENVKGKKIAIISSSWHPELCQKLIDSAIRACNEYGVKYEVLYVPGSFEIPLAAKQLLATAKVRRLVDWKSFAGIVPVNSLSLMSMLVITFANLASASASIFPERMLC